jgi:hypothetical protein
MARRRLTKTKWTRLRRAFIFGWSLGAIAQATGVSRGELILFKLLQCEPRKITDLGFCLCLLCESYLLWFSAAAAAAAAVRFDAVDRRVFVFFAVNRFEVVAQCD